jgi:hypothetical protein
VRLQRLDELLVGQRDAEVVDAAADADAEDVAGLRRGVGGVDFSNRPCSAGCVSRNSQTSWPCCAARSRAAGREFEALCKEAALQHDLLDQVPAVHAALRSLGAVVGAEGGGEP